VAQGGAGIDVVELSSGDDEKKRRQNAADEPPEDKGGLRAVVGSGEGRGGIRERVSRGCGWEYQY
jgi:hypothetical protein